MPSRGPAARASMGIPAMGMMSNRVLSFWRYASSEAMRVRGGARAAASSAAAAAAAAASASSAPVGVLGGGGGPVHTEPLGWAVEGNICSGKTTLCRHVHAASVSGSASRSGLRQVTVAYEPIAEDALALFYGDVPKYAFWFQTYMLALRLSEAQSLGIGSAAAIEGSATALLDRSLLGDMAFAVRQHLDGNISEQELAAYHAIRRERGFDDPTACAGTEASTSSSGDGEGRVDGRRRRQSAVSLLYIDVDPAVCHERIARRGVEAERAIPLQYLEDLDAVYINLVLKVRWHQCAPQIEEVYLLSGVTLTWGGAYRARALSVPSRIWRHF